MTERGFTLIEILLTLSIMLVLVLVAVPRFVGASHRAEILWIESELQWRQLSLQMQRSATGDWPEQNSLEQVVNSERGTTWSLRYTLGEKGVGILATSASFPGCKITLDSQGNRHKLGCDMA